MTNAKSRVETQNREHSSYNLEFRTFSSANPRCSFDIRIWNFLSSTVLDLSLTYVQRCQLVTPLPMIQASEFVALETLFAFVMNLGVGIASGRAMQDR